MEYRQIVYQESYNTEYYLTFGYVPNNDRYVVISKVWEGHFTNDNRDKIFNKFKLRIIL